MQDDGNGKRGLERLRAIVENQAAEGEPAATLRYDDAARVMEEIEEGAVALPRTADGSAIRPGMEVYDPLGAAYTVDLVSFGEEGEQLRVMDALGVLHFWSCDEDVYARRPDSWERLENDAKKGSACAFWGSRDGKCLRCELNQASERCERDARIDLVARAKRLAGVE